MTTRSLVGAPFDPRVIDSVSRVRVLRLPESGLLADLLEGVPPSLVYSNEEQRHCQRRRDLTGWAGRLAAKLAVADVLDLDGRRNGGLSEIQILPRRQGFCTEGPGCLKPHPPQVVLSGRAALLSGDGEIRVSISHTQARAIALAVGLRERSVETP